VQARERGSNKGEVARLFGVSLSSVERFSKMAREGLPLKPGKTPGKRPKIDERGRRLLEDDLEKRPATSLQPKHGGGYFLGEVLLAEDDPGPARKLLDIL